MTLQIRSSYKATIKFALNNCWPWLGGWGWGWSVSSAPRGVTWPPTPETGRSFYGLKTVCRMLQRLTTCKNSRADFGIIRIGSLSLSCQMSSSLSSVWLLQLSKCTEVKNVSNWNWAKSNICLTSGWSHNPNILRNSMIRMSWWRWEIIWKYQTIEIVESQQKTGHSQCAFLHSTLHLYCRISISLVLWPVFT